VPAGARVAVAGGGGGGAKRLRGTVEPARVQQCAATATAPASPLAARPQCDAGEAAPRPAQLVTTWQRLLYGKDIVGLVHVLGFTERAFEGVPV
jgi:hypothetical protein